MNGDRALCRQANAFLNPLIVEMVFALACLCGARIAKLTTASAEMVFAYSEMAFVPAEMAFSYPKVRFSLRLFPLQTIDLRFF